MKVALLFLCGLLTVLQAFPSPVVYTKDSVAIKFTNCSQPDTETRAEIVSVDIQPNPAVIGKYVTVSAATILKEDVTSGNIKYTAKYGIIKIGKNVDLCPDGKGCPLAKGNRTISLQIMVPSIGPPGTYKINVEITDQDEKELGCIDFELQVVRN